MKASVLDMSGKKKKDIELPSVFSTPYRPDLINRAVLSSRSNRRQAYGPNKLAGMRSAARYYGSRHLPSDKQMMNKEMARLPRESGDTAALFRAHTAVQTKGGRMAHPPKPEKILTESINKKERVLAIKSAIAATANLTLVKSRNHSYDGSLPIVIEDGVQKVSKTKELAKILNSLGFEKEMERLSEVKIRQGRGKMRGRRYRTKVGPAIVVSKDDGIGKVNGLTGVDIINVKRLSAENLSPGAHGARAVIWTESSINALKERFG